MAVMMAVFGISLTANADCGTCCPPWNIDRGCETAATNAECYSTPFDFDECTTDGNCQGMCPVNPVKEPCIQKAWFEICQCLEVYGGPWASLQQGDTIDVSMEILVNGQTGDNGVYWAENVNTAQGIAMDTYADLNAACDDTLGLTKQFEQNWIYELWDGSIATTTPYTGNMCAVPVDQKITKFCPDPTQTDAHGYIITADDDLNNNDTWIVDIPALRADSSIASAGDVVQVKVCFQQSLLGGGVCGSCEECCCTITIGTLCCETAPDEPCCIYHPYVLANDPYGFWGTGIAITNVGCCTGSADMEATLTLTDASGNTATATLDSWTGPIWSGNMDSLAWSSTLTGACWLKIEANFPVSSYCYLTGNANFGAGTLAVPCHCSCLTY